MSNPEMVPLPNPEGLPMDDQANQRKNSMVKRFFKNFSVGRLFARKKTSNSAGNPMEQVPSAANEPNDMDMHEMQVLHDNQSRPIEPQPYPVQEPEPLTAS
ncbi:hypothetical protein KR059_011302 [Drosophila kikkawai]|nr:hypothetical protein KR059_011302 [Drosophila kikkawai]